MQATTIKASITAYSTAVGPSSLVRNRRIFEPVLNIFVPSLPHLGDRASGGTEVPSPPDSRASSRGGKHARNRNRLTVGPVGVRADSSRAERAADRAERATDARAQILDDRDASHDDQGQH